MTTNEEIEIVSPDLINKTYFISNLKHFPPLVNNKINTKEFLAASGDIIHFIDKFGKVFAPIRNDIHGSIQKLYKKYNENPGKNRFLEDMLLREKDEGGIVVKESLQWLRRNLHFILRFLQLIIEDAEVDFVEQNFSSYLRVAYSETLQLYHGWMGSHLFNIMVRFSPSRKEFFSVLTVDPNEDESSIINGMEFFVEGLERCIVHLIEFYNRHELENS